MIQQRDMSDSLEVFTLGKLQIQRNGLTLANFPTRKVEALLVYLACTGRSFPREQLAELLWEDRTQSQSLSNLRAALSRLNEQVALFLYINRKDVSIQPQAKVWVDSVELSASLQSNKWPLSSSAANRLEHAITLYKGDFLAGFYISESQGFEDWQRAERERLRVGVMEALSQLANFYLEQGRFDAGLTHATRLLELDPCAETYNAIQLFVQSARRVDPGFHLDDVTDVVRICKLVEGLPLAIELAASWVHQMPCERIASQIQRDLDFLSTNLRNVPERHKGTRALFEHSWRLLSGDEQAVLRKLSVFRGGFDADAAEHIVGTSLYILSALAEKSLVRSSPSGRYDLHELLRQFAEEKLREADELAATRDCHLDYFVTWAEEANLRLRGVEQMTWYQRIEIEHDNLREALRWGINGQKAETGLRLAEALWWFWFRRGYWREGFEWLKVGIERTEGDTSTRAYAMSYAATLLLQIQHIAMIRSYLEEALRIGQKLGLQDLVAMSYVSLSFTEADYEKVTELLEQALSLLRQVNARFKLTAALFLYGDRARAQGDLSRAETLYQESLTIAQADQNRELMTSPLGNLGRLAVYRDDYERATMLIQQTVEIARELGSRVGIADWLVYLGTLELYRGNYNAAEKYLEETLALFRDLGNQLGIAHVYHCMANLALHQGDYDRAAKLISDSLSLSQSFLVNFSNREFSVARLLIVGKLALAHHDYEEAVQLFGAAEALREQNGYLLEPLPRVEYSEAIAEVQKYLDTTVFEVAWAKGQAMAEAEAIIFALDYVHSVYALGGMARVTASQGDKALAWAQGRTMTPERAPASKGSVIPSKETSPMSSTALSPTYPDGLTRREVEVLRLIAEGWTDAQIAEHLVISPRTVNHHLTSIYHKIQVSSRSAATRYAVEQHLV
jgi:predicted ATPase/DNA-binding CsgD family transcriptional regulator